MAHSNMWPRGDWFTRHLNRTVVLYYLLGVCLGAMFLAFADEEMGYILFEALGVVWLGGLLYLLVWSLKHKGRSLCNLLYLLIPGGIGFIVLLFVSNQEQLAGDKEIRDKILEGRQL